MPSIDHPLNQIFIRHNFFLVI